MLNNIKDLFLIWYNIFFLFLVNIIILTQNNFFFKNYFFLFYSNFNSFIFILVFFNAYICFMCILFFDIKSDNSMLIVVLLFIILIILSFLFTLDDIFLFFFLYELVLLPSSIICFLSSPNLRSKMVTYYFIFWTQTGSFFFFFVICYLYSINIYYFFSINYFNFSKVELILLSILLYVGFGIKIPVFPFHFWLTKTHVEVNTSFSIFLSGVLVKIALLGFYKFITLFSYLNFLYFFVSIISMLDICTKLLLQVDFKKIVAYCTIFEMNIILVNLFFFNYNTLVFLIFFCILHTILSNLFFSINDFLYKKFSTRNINNINSLFYSTPKLFYITFISLLLFNAIPFSLKFNLELLIFLKLYNIDFLFLSLFFFIQLLFTLFLNKIIYQLLFNNINYTFVSDVNKNEFFFISINFIFLFLL